MNILFLASAATTAAVAHAEPVTVGGSVVPPSSVPFIRTSFDDNHFYDDFGRVRIFHGGNRVEKHFPWLFESMVASDDELDGFASVGFNVMRLGWMWTGFNPEENVFNYTYAKQFAGIVRRMAERGIYTLLDMHQDVMSSKFCLYDGVPLWVVNKSTPNRPFPWPLQGNCSSRSWGANWATEAAVHACQDLYDNHNGMLDDLANFWKTSAQLWKDEPGVIGYELINEPFAGDFFKDPAIMLPGEAGAKNLQPMYHRLAEAIRPFDDRHIIFFEPVTWGMIFNSTVAGSGFTEVPGGPSHCIVRQRPVLIGFWKSEFVPFYCVILSSLCCC